MEIIKPKLLLIMKDKAMLEQISNQLTKNGYDVDTVASGKDAIEKSNMSFYNIALVDIALPDVNYIRLLKKLGNCCHMPRMHKIIISNKEHLEDIIDAINNHADSCLVKPIKSKYLCDIVDKHIKIQKYEETMIDTYIKSHYIPLVKQ